MREGDRLRRRYCRNPSTRKQAVSELADVLQRLLRDGRRTLAGFDFPNAYPKGFAKKAGFHGPAWRAVWDGLAALAEDGPDNANNRFAVGEELNRRLSGSDYPFWGHPHQHSYAHLPPKPAATPEQAGLPARRLCEAYLPQTKTCWQLAYNGSVGGQALLGIPAQRALRHHPALAADTRVWPFETGLAARQDGRIILAEVYPSILPVSPKPGEVKDALQVCTTARAFARRDRDGLLAKDLAGPDDLSLAERRLVEREEGWILGAGTFRGARQ